jgi:hypothetical protein
MSPVELVAVVCDVSRPIEERLAAAGRARGWLDATTLALTNELARVRRPDVEVAESACLSGRSVDRELRRAGTVDVVPELGVALAGGLVSVDHVDVLDRVLRRVEGEQRERLLERAPGLVAQARGRRPEEFERQLRSVLAVIESEADRQGRLARQRKAARFRTWVDRSSGMWRCSGEFDPETGVHLQQRLDREVGAQFAAGVPAGGPDDTLERHHWLAAQAAAALWLGDSGSHRRGGRSGGAEIVVAVRPDAAGGSMVDWGLPVELPRAVFDELFHDPTTTVIGVVVRDGVVVHAPGQLELGRSTRLANRAQRRALRALHATCGVTGCEVRFDDCSMHHIIWWRHGGPSDLWNLVPLCWRHHAAVHDGTLVLPPPRPPPQWRPP